MAVRELLTSLCVGAAIVLLVVLFALPAYAVPSPSCPNPCAGFVCPFTPNGAGGNFCTHKGDNCTGPGTCGCRVYGNGADAGCGCGQ